MSSPDDVTKCCIYGGEPIISELFFDLFDLITTLSLVPLIKSDVSFSSAYLVTIASRMVSSTL